MRREDPALLRGEGQFIDDFDPFTNTREAALLRSPDAHARIRAIDVTATAKLAVAVAVLKDFAGVIDPIPNAIRAPPNGSREEGLKTVTRGREAPTAGRHDH